MILYCFVLLHVIGPKILIESNPAFDLGFENKQKQPAKKVAAAVRGRRATMVDSTSGFGDSTKILQNKTTHALCDVELGKAIVFISCATTFGLY